MTSSYRSLLTQFISYPSISTDPEHKNDMTQTAWFLVDLLSAHGFTAQAITGYSNPIVVARYITDPSYETVLIYGHYDVQPADLSEGWTNDPFVLTEREWRLYARGVVDNKGQIMIHIATVLDLISQGKLRYNIVFMIEGDEETWSPHLERFINEQKDLLKADYTLISDGEIIGDHTPTLIAAFRGGCNLTLTLRTASDDLHSGLYGNIAPNSAYEMSHLLGKLYDDRAMIAVPWRYDSVAPITPEQKENNTHVPFSFEETQQITGIKALYTPDGYDPTTANGLLPTIEISWIQSGYTGNGYRNAIPAQTMAKINFRFAPGQDAQQMMQLFSQRVTSQLPAYVDHTIEMSDAYDAITLRTDHPKVQEARDILSTIYGRAPILRYCGAAIPVTGLFQDLLWQTVIVVDLANEDCHMHGVDENFSISCIDKGLAFSQQFLSTHTA